MHDVLDVHRKRTEREVSAHEPGHDNESGISAYDEMLKWGKRKNVTDIAEAATPCRNAGREPPKKSARGRNGHGRHTEHAKDALLDKKSGHSKFHRTYPRKEAPFMPTCKRGNFENLTQYVGMAWDPSDLNAVHAICDTTENGIFEWPEEVLANLRADRWNNMNMQQKQLNMVGYLLEIFYDMALAPGDNVSENPGFERYLLDHSRANVQ